MSTECYPIAMLPHTTKLFRDYLAMSDAANAQVRGWYGAEPLGRSWMRAQSWDGDRERLAESLERQNREIGAGSEALANVEKIRAGARAVVSGQQVGLLGGPLLTLLKAATAVARAKQATAATGMEHVPIFWVASEDHDLEEVNQVSLLTKTAVETLRLELKDNGTSVGDVEFGDSVDGLLERACELLGHTPVCDVLRECYAPKATFAGGFARLIARLFAEQGLIVMDAAGRDFHALGAGALRTALEQAGDLEAALLQRSKELETAGYHAQVLVKPGTSLLFLIGEDGVRRPLRRTGDGTWKAGSGSGASSYSTAELLEILEREPERLSPNALLRPVFQDSILPTTAYVGGPAEVAYFAQSAVVYERVLGRVTPILPRLSATLIEPAIGSVMEQQEVSLPHVMCGPDELAQHLGARAMPIEAKRRLAGAGKALGEALTAAQEYLGTLDAGLGKSAEVSASKMLYQMDRLRRLAANFELQKEASLRKHADAMALQLFPEGHPQERVIAGVWFVAAYETMHAAEERTPGTGLIARLVDEAKNQCPGHVVARM